MWAYRQTKRAEWGEYHTFVCGSVRTNHPPCVIISQLLYTGIHRLTVTRADGSSRLRAWLEIGKSLF